MFIVNQNETEIVNVDNLITIQLDDNVIWGISNVGKIPLGNYEADEKAKEAFEKIKTDLFPKEEYGIYMIGASVYMPK